MLYGTCTKQARFNKHIYQVFFFLQASIFLILGNINSPTLWATKDTLKRAMLTGTDIVLATGHQVCGGIVMYYHPNCG